MDEVDEFLAHYGVMGMKWGVRRSSDGTPTRGELRGMNRANRRADKAANRAAKAEVVRKSDASIDRARSMQDSHAAKTKKAWADYKTARKTYKVEKRTIGSYAAKKNRGEAWSKYMLAVEKEETNFILANKTKSGKETTDKMLADIGKEVLKELAKR